VQRPQCVAAYTNDLIYSRLAPGILEELESRNPIENGIRKGAHHQLLTGDVGNPALAQHLYGVIGLMRASTNWEQMKKLIDSAYPKREDASELKLFVDGFNPAELQ